MEAFPKNATVGDLYRPAMKIQTKREARRYLRRLIAYAMAHGQTAAEAERIQKSNLGYFAGYYDEETRARVERLFDCKHPIFGAIAENGQPTFEQAFSAGKAAVQDGR